MIDKKTFGEFSALIEETTEHIQIMFNIIVSRRKSFDNEEIKKIVVNLTQILALVKKSNIPNVMFIDLPRAIVKGSIFHLHDNLEYSIVYFKNYIMPSKEEEKPVSIEQLYHKTLLNKLLFYLNREVKGENKIKPPSPNAIIYNGFIIELAPVIFIQGVEPPKDAYIIRKEEGGDTAPAESVEAAKRWIDEAIERIADQKREKERIEKSWKKESTPQSLESFVKKAEASESYKGYLIIKKESKYAIHKGDMSITDVESPEAAHQWIDSQIKKQMSIKKMKEQMDIKTSPRNIIASLEKLSASSVILLAPKKASNIKLIAGKLSDLTNVSFKQKTRGIGKFTKFKLSIDVTQAELPKIEVKLPDKFKPMNKFDKEGNQFSLMDHQVEAAERILTQNLHEDGFVLMDDAGVGKSHAVLAVIRYYQDEAKKHNEAIAKGAEGIIKKGSGEIMKEPVYRKFLIVVPIGNKKGLIAQWVGYANESYVKINFKTKGSAANLEMVGDFENMRKSKEGVFICGYDDLSREAVDSINIPYDNTPFFYVFFDESHAMKNLTNSSGKPIKTTLYGYYVQKKAQKVLYISATPFQELNDVHYLWKLGLWDKDKTYAITEKAAKYIEFTLESLKAEVIDGSLTHKDLLFMIKKIDEDVKLDKVNQTPKFFAPKHLKIDENGEAQLTNWINKLIKQKQKEKTPESMDWLTSEEANIESDAELENYKIKTTIEYGDGFNEFRLQNGAREEITKEGRGKKEKRKIIQNPNPEYQMALNIMITMRGYGLKRLFNMAGLQTSFREHTISDKERAGYDAGLNLVDWVLEYARSNEVPIKTMYAMRQFWARHYLEHLKIPMAIKIAVTEGLDGLDYDTLPNPGETGTPTKLGYYDQSGKFIHTPHQVICFTDYNTGGHSHIKACHDMVVDKMHKSGKITDDEWHNATADGDPHDKYHRSKAENDFSVDFWAKLDKLKEVQPITQSLTDLIAQEINNRSKAAGNPLKNPSALVAKVWGEERKGSNANKERMAFQDGTKRFCVASMSKGGTGLSFHDEKNIAPRTQINLTLPWSGYKFIQVAGRTHRLGTYSNTRMFWLYVNTDEEKKMASIVYYKLLSLNSLVSGTPFADVSTGSIGWDVMGQDEEVVLTSEMNIDPKKVHDHYIAFYKDPVSFREKYYETNKEKILKAFFTGEVKQIINDDSLIITGLDPESSIDSETIRLLNLVVAEIGGLTDKAKQDLLKKQIKFWNSKGFSVSESTASTLAELKTRVFLEVDARYRKLGNPPSFPEFKKQQDMLKKEKESIDQAFAEPEKQWQSLEKASYSARYSAGGSYDEFARKFTFPKAFAENVYRMICLGQYDPEHPELNPPRLLERKEKGRAYHPANKISSFFIYSDNSKKLMDVLNIFIQKKFASTVIKKEGKKGEDTFVKPPYILTKVGKHAILCFGKGNRSIGYIDLADSTVYPATTFDEGLMKLIYNFLYDKGTELRETGKVTSTTTSMQEEEETPTMEMKLESWSLPEFALDSAEMNAELMALKNDDSTRWIYDLFMADMEYYRTEKPIW